MVKDLTLARRFVMQKLAVGMLSILDQLHNEVRLLSINIVPRPITADLQCLFLIRCFK